MAAYHQGAGHTRYQHRNAGPGVGGWLNHHRKRELVRLHQTGDQEHKAVTKHHAQRQRDGDANGHFTEQQPRHLGARKTQHAQAGQLPGALGQRNARIVVDHADGNYRRKQRQHRAHDADVARAYLLHVAQQAGLAENADHARQLLARFQHCRLHATFDHH